MTVSEEHATASPEAQPATGVARKDKKLVDLVKAALVDPNLHTDTRVRVHRAIVKILAAPDRARGRRSGPE